MIAFVYLFMFLIVMVGLLIFFEQYAKQCRKNNVKVARHTNWLIRAGMKETCFLIDKRWKQGL